MHPLSCCDCRRLHLHLVQSVSALRRCSESLKGELLSCELGCCSRSWPRPLAGCSTLRLCATRSMRRKATSAKRARCGKGRSLRPFERRLRLKRRRDSLNTTLQRLCRFLVPRLAVFPDHLIRGHNWWSPVCVGVQSWRWGMSCVVCGDVYRAGVLS